MHAHSGPLDELVPRECAGHRGVPHTWWTSRRTPSRSSGGRWVQATRGQGGHEEPGVIRARRHRTRRWTSRRPALEGWAHGRWEAALKALRSDPRKRLFMYNSGRRRAGRWHSERRRGPTPPRIGWVHHKMAVD